MQSGKAFSLLTCTDHLYGTLCLAIAASFWWRKNLERLRSALSTEHSRHLLSPNFCNCLIHTPTVTASFLFFQQCALKETLSLITIETTALSGFAYLRFITLRGSYLSYK